MSSAIRTTAPGRLILTTILALAALAAAYGALVAGRTFYYAAADMGGHGRPTPLLEHPEQTGVAGIRDVEFNSRDGTLMRAWYVPSRNGGALAVGTGTDANRATMLPEVRILAGAKFGVLAFDWPGTGLSAGKVDWGVGSQAAMEGAIDWLARRRDIARGQIGVLGFSGGGAVAVRVAVADPRIRAVVLTGTSPESTESPHWFHRSAHPLKVLPAEWAARYFGWPVGTQRPIDLIGRLAPRPVLMVGGSDDPNADPALSNELFHAAGEPKELWIAPGATHGGYAEAAPEEYARHLLDFLERYLLVPAAPASVHGQMGAPTP